MNDILNEIRMKVGEENLIHTCSGKHCRVDMVNIPEERIVVNVDQAFVSHNVSGKHCDRILFFINPTENKLVVVLIEHKGSTFDSARDIAKQLQGGADFAKDVIPEKINTTCVPILFHGDGNHPLQFRKLRREKIFFGGKKFPIDKDKCNTTKNLLNVLKRSDVLS